MNPGRRINRPQRGSRARLVAAAFAVTLLASIAAPRPVLAQAGGYDDDGTTVVGSASGGVTVDLSVLNDLGAPDRGRDLRFPGSRLGPDQAIRLHPPEIQLHPPRKKARRVRRPPASVRPKPRPAPPSATAEAPAAPAMPETAAPPAAPPAPPKVASAPPEPMTPPPAPETSAPAKAPEMARGSVTPPPPPTVPEPPQASRSASPLPPDLPPITPAPREGVESGSVPPPPAPETRKSESQTASLPPATSGGVGGFAPGVTRAIAFGAGQASLASAGEATLKAAAQALTANAALRVELKAYATGDKDNESRARRLSLSRALAVRSFLIKEGVQATRIDVRALGSQVPSGPADRVDVTLISR